MFNLEQSISEWRKQMLAAGIKTPVPLEELESHLREEIERQILSGSNERVAFDIAVQEIGQTKVLKTEFAKIGGTIHERLKSFIFTRVGIPNLRLATNMTTSNQKIEPRWTTYKKHLSAFSPHF